MAMFSKNICSEKGSLDSTQVCIISNTCKMQKELSKFGSDHVSVDVPEDDIHISVVQYQDSSMTMKNRYLRESKK